jgi:hypothetical protein
MTALVPFQLGLCGFSVKDFLTVTMILRYNSSVRFTQFIHPTMKTMSSLRHLIFGIVISVISVHTMPRLHESASQVALQVSIHRSSLVKCKNLARAT